MLKRLVLLGVGLLVGVAIGVACTYAVMHRKNHNWIELTMPYEDFPIAYSIKVVDADIPVPGVRNPHGQAKFVGPGVGTATKLGFRVKVSMDKLDTTKLPEKYKKPQQQGKITTLPVDSVTYSAHLEFTLKDADGFMLASTESDPVYVQSGEENAAT